MKSWKSFVDGSASDAKVLGREATKRALPSAIGKTMIRPSPMKMWALPWPSGQLLRVRTLLRRPQHRSLGSFSKE